MTTSLITVITIVCIIGVAVTGVYGGYEYGSHNPQEAHVQLMTHQDGDIVATGYIDLHKGGTFALPVNDTTTYVIGI